METYSSRKKTEVLDKRFGLRKQGSATVDLVLLMGIILPLAAFLFWACPRIMGLVYNMTCVQWSWPFP